jgi:hypothetical protein
MIVVIELIGSKGEWDKEVGLETVGHARRHHANHGVGFAIQAELLADDVSVAAETLLPKTVGHDDDVVAAWRRFFGQKIAAQEERDALHVEKTGRDDAGFHDFGTTRSGQVEAVAGRGDDILKDGTLAFPVEIIGRGNGVVVAVDAGPDHNELVGIGIGQGR